MADIQDYLGDYSTRGMRSRSRRAPLTIVFADLPPNPLRDERLDLRALVEREVVPRLRGTSGRVEVRGVATVSPGMAAANEVAACGDRLIANDRTSVCDRIEAFRLAGRSMESIFLDVLAPTASYLKRMWADDDCGFAEATLALVNLQAVLRQFAPAFRAEASAHETGRRAMLVAPRAGLDVGTTMFGLMLMSEFFRRSGWDAWIEPDLASPAFAAAVTARWFDVVEVLVQSDKNLDEVASGIKTIRRGSPNRSVGVVVYGQIFVDHPEFVRLVGADLTSSDPRSSVIEAQQFVSLTTSAARLR